MTPAPIDPEELVIYAFDILDGRAPYHADYQAHLKFINDFGQAHYLNTLEGIFATHSDAELAKWLLQATGLNGIDLEGDGNFDNIALATSFIQANSGNRVKAMLDIAHQLANNLTDELGGIGYAYTSKLRAGYRHAKDPSSTDALYYNSNYHIEGTDGNDTLYTQNKNIGQYKIDGQDVESKALWIFNTAEQNSNFSSTWKVSSLKGGTPTTVGSYGVKVQARFRDQVLSKEIAIDDKGDFQASQQDINQAVKQAINHDAVLSKLLETIDGPDGSLGVLAKIDGSMHTDRSLDIRFIAPEISDLTPEVVRGFIAKNPASGVHDAASLLSHIQNFVTDANSASSLHAKFYAQTQFALDDGYKEINGYSVIYLRNHVVTGSTGDDLIVLQASSQWVLNAMETSSDLVRYSGPFGHDTLVNFDPRVDKFDFGLLNKSSYEILNSASGPLWGSSQVSVVGEVSDGAIHLAQKNVIDGVTASTADNDSAEDVKQLFTDGTTGLTQLYIAVDHATATGDVYQVIDGVGTNDLTVTLLGNLTLISSSDAGTRPIWQDIHSSLHW